MDIEKEREEFEQWAKTQMLSFLHRFSDGDYQSSATNNAWIGWQARAKQTITLPVKDATGEH